MSDQEAKRQCVSDLLQSSVANKKLPRWFESPCRLFIALYRPIVIPAIRKAGSSDHNLKRKFLASLKATCRTSMRCMAKNLKVDDRIVRKADHDMLDLKSYCQVPIGIF
jgi:hypothetical protein